jgi:hypothetical protein
LSSVGTRIQSAVDGAGPSPDARLEAYGAVSTALALHSDRELRELVDAATPLGVGGRKRPVLLDVAGTPVFVKRVPLTETEQLPDHIRSTANIFELPAFCHYGVGSPGFGVWREAAAHTMTTNWVLSGQHQGFPLTYHWRILPRPDEARPLPERRTERIIAFWGGGSEVRRRIEALQQSPATLALFLEFVPQTLEEWLTERMQAGDETADRACALVEKELETGLSFMSDRGFLHFDPHFQNILTDGRRLYFTDYGLSISSRFDLSPAEVDFFDKHGTYDRAYTFSYLVNWLINCLYGYERAEREALIRACAEGERPPAGPSEAMAILSRHAPLAAVMTDFYTKLQEESRESPYPLEAIREIFALRRD